MRRGRGAASIVLGIILGCAPATPVKLAVPEPLPSLGMPIAPGVTLHLGDQPPAYADSTFYVFRSATDSFPVRGYRLSELFVGGMAWVYTDWWDGTINDIVVEFRQPVTRENVIATLAEEIGSGPQLFNSLPGSDVTWVGADYEQLTVTQEADGSPSMLRARLTWGLRNELLVAQVASVNPWSDAAPPDLVFRTCFEASVIHCPPGSTLRDR